MFLLYPRLDIGLIAIFLICYEKS